MKAVGIIKDKDFWKKTLLIGIPIALQELLSTGLNLVDTLMLSSMGDATVAATGLANKIFFIFTIFIFGISSGSGILTSQYWGKREVENIRKVLGISILIGIGVSLSFLLPSVTVPQMVMRILTPNQEMIKIGAVYLCITVWGYPIMAVAKAYASAMRGMNQVVIPAIINLLAIVLNIFLNYLLIFGNCGFPELGVVGAAVATIIARYAEGIGLLVIIYIKKNPAATTIKKLFDFNIVFVKKYIITILPVVANEFMWGLGITMYSLVYGRMRDVEVAAITITQTIEEVFLVIFQGISAASAVVLGNELGADRLKRADRYAVNYILLQTAFSLMMSFACLMLRLPIIHLFRSITYEVQSLVNCCLRVFAIFLPFKMLNYLIITGILRSGGDTKAAFVLEVTGVWCVGIPLAVLGGLVLKLPIYVVYAMVFLEEFYRFVLSFIRYRKKKWLKNIIEK